MDHIRQFDWCTFDSNDHFFLNEEDIDNHCVTEKILSNKFYDPLISSGSEDESIANIDWDKVFKKKTLNPKEHRHFVPGLRAVPPHLKISALTALQHFQCLKVLCARNPTVLGGMFVPKPSNLDRKVFEDIQEIYLKEQKEYIEWAKNLWTQGHCIRALRPKSQIETVYEAEYKMWASELQSLPKVYEVAAQIPLETAHNKFNLVHQKSLVKIEPTKLPPIKFTQILSELKIIKQCQTPQPCEKHPCRFVLPNEKTVSILPLTEVYTELAQYALDNGAHYIASEESLKCLLELDRSWTISLSVCQVIGADGDRNNVLVLGREFSVNKESAPIRTYKALKHMLHSRLVGFAKQYSDVNETNSSINTSTESEGQMAITQADLSSDDEDNLVMDTQEDFNGTTTVDTQVKCTVSDASDKPKNKEKSVSKIDKKLNKIAIYDCTCKGTAFHTPLPRSFRMWQVKNITTQDHYKLIVHCAHYCRGDTGEVLLEPIPEYQLELGASQQSECRVKSIALSMYLRTNASVMNVRVDCGSGNAATFETIYPNQLTETNPDMIDNISNTIHTTINQLEGLLPGYYILQHEPSHGSNAILLVPRNTGESYQFKLTFDCLGIDESNEAKDLKMAPTLVPVLLPWHPFRKILPCAFTPNQWQVAKEKKIKIQKETAPKWPTKKKKGRKKKGRQGVKTSKK